VRTASTCRTIDRQALAAGMLSRRIDASAKIASPAEVATPGEPFISPVLPGSGRGQTCRSLPQQGH
jgi:hypothetical protein